jgi:phosphoadenosine phosphosulfate reductase
MNLLDRTAPAARQARHHNSPDADANALNATLAALPSLEARLGAITAAIPGRIAFSSSLSIEDQAITHAIATTDANVEVFTLDTGRHFPETYNTLFETEARYGRKIRIVFPDAEEVEQLVSESGINGFRYTIEARKTCCEIRKVRPLNRALAGSSAWITGLRREQSQGRGTVPLAANDPVQKLIKLSPIADWTLEMLEDYVARNDIPVNALHAQGYPSIGCQPCTRAVLPGQDIRGGRWWWESEDTKECGLHMRK